VAGAKAPAALYCRKVTEPDSSSEPRKSNKNDFIDAEAIAEAVTKLNMRFVPAEVGSIPMLNYSVALPSD
jgi:hypothetical protein